MPVPVGLLTERAPVVAAPGTVAMICVGDRTLNKAAAPLNVTAVTFTKSEPVIVTLVPGDPPAGLA